MRWTVRLILAKLRGNVEAVGRLKAETECMTQMKMEAVDICFTEKFVIKTDHYVKISTSSRRLQLARIFKKHHTHDIRLRSLLQYACSSLRWSLMHSAAITPPRDRLGIAATASNSCPLALRERGQCENSPLSVSTCPGDWHSTIELSIRTAMVDGHQGWYIVVVSLTFERTVGGLRGGDWTTHWPPQYTISHGAASIRSTMNSSKSDAETRLDFPFVSSFMVIKWCWTAYLLPKISTVNAKLLPT